MSASESLTLIVVLVLVASLVARCLSVFWQSSSVSKRRNRAKKEPATREKPGRVRSRQRRRRGVLAAGERILADRAYCSLTNTSVSATSR